MRWERNEFVAGHQFYPAGTCHCNRRWVDIRNTTRAEIGQEGIAHYGKLTMNECEQIERKRGSEDAAHAAAMSVAVGSTITAAPAAVDDDWMLFCKRFWKVSCD